MIALHRRLCRRCRHAHRLQLCCYSSSFHPRLLLQDRSLHAGSGLRAPAVSPATMQSPRTMIPQCLSVGRSAQVSSGRDGLGLRRAASSRAERDDDGLLQVSSFAANTAE
ncbi:hypothetical protein AAFF_G00167660 [Aldrovandia affinis]|uniref:Uncharacterized protein n=1 Tax=Aldrovandia affinis TaxID=143900 RepID=A0AAD7RM84_9TELE|nr:hypothetical protein AAFF_G00167660 [Aldrovandia affinis]